jgi:hypothetical protein
MKRLIFIFCLLFIGVAYAGDGDVNLIAKIAPKNNAFVNIVDALNVGVDTTDFDGNLSSLDDTLQKALETIDELAFPVADDFLNLADPDQTVIQTPTFSGGLNSSDDISLASGKKIYTDSTKTSYHYTDASTGYTRFYYSNVEIMRFEH